MSTSRFAWLALQLLVACPPTASSTDSAVVVSASERAPWHERLTGFRTPTGTRKGLQKSSLSAACSYFGAGHFP